ncbi:MAG: filamentous hemagglutinin, partial [Bacteroidota bacterium]
LAGGDINASRGGIVSIDGQIILGAVGGEGTLGLNFDNDSPIFEFPEGLSRADVSLTSNAGFLVSGSGGGDIAITARNIEISEGSSLFAGIFSGLGSLDAQAGDISISANSLSVIGESSIDSRTSGLGNGANVSVSANNLSLTNGGSISASTFGQGDAGDINIFSNNVEIDGGDDGILTGLFAQVGQGAT